MAENYQPDINEAVQVLAAGGLLLYPTDTIWGIGCDATNEAAVEKVYRLKRRPDEKSLIVLLATEKDILQYVTQPDPGVFHYLKTITQPTTVIYEGALGFAGNLLPPDGTIAIRVVKDPFCQQLIKKFGKPLVSTSANISGSPSPVNFAAIEEEIKKGVDYIVQHRRDETAPALPSAIVKWNADGSLTVLRS
ncbi:MAG: L-threonylcarbamoyladenylate synthase [Ferruginibacter sp.]